MLSTMKEMPTATSTQEQDNQKQSGQQDEQITTTTTTTSATVTTGRSTENDTIIATDANAPTTPPHIEGAKTAPGGTKGGPRDSSWLELEACREHLRLNCPRSAEECRFAHPEPRILVKDGKVTCCYDFLKDRCHRDKCRYFHPPAHIKEQLVSAGKTFGAMMSNLHLIQTGSYPGTLPPMFPPSVPLLAPVVYGPGGRVMSAAPTPPTPQFRVASDRIEICPSFVQGKCDAKNCSLVHPEPYVRRNLDSTVTVCRDYLRGGCSRDQCRYFHPAANLMPAVDVCSVVPQGVVFPPPPPPPATVMPMYSPILFPVPGPSPLPSIPSPDAAGISTSGYPVYPSLPVHSMAGPMPVPMPVALHPQGVNIIPFPNHVPISTITSGIQVISNSVPKDVVMPTPVRLMMGGPCSFQH